MIEQDGDNTTYLQLTLFSFLRTDTQIAADILRAMGSDPFEHRSLLAFDYVRHEERWTSSVDILYFKFEYDSMCGWQ